MIEITDREFKCCMDSKHGCKALNTSKCKKDECSFYKPVGCEKWIRVDEKDHIYLYEPEELKYVRCEKCSNSRIIPGNKRHMLCVKYEIKVKHDSYCSNGRSR